MKRSHRPALSPAEAAQAVRCLARAPAAKAGYTAIIRPGSRGGDPATSGVAFGLLRVRAGASHRETTKAESVYVLLAGAVEVRLGDRVYRAERTSLFDEGPATFHVGVGAVVEIRAGRSEVEFAVARTPNTRTLPPRIYGPQEVTTEDRGAGLVQGACRRLVRTIFDYGTRPDSNLVVGEVVNYPGRWSSYPGHHHAQPEIYHYRFTQPQGYGHAELGDAVLKVRGGDTVSIPGGLDHAQVSAPGYGMYYLWIVRHLPRRPYRGFTFSPEHRWLLDPAQQGWTPTLPALSP